MSVPASAKQTVLTFRSSSKAKTKADVLWALRCVASGFSSNSCQDISTLFQHMFLGNEITEEFKMG